MPGTFELFPVAPGTTQYRLRDADGAVLALGRGYDSPATARAVCERVREIAAEGAEIVEVER